MVNKKQKKFLNKLDQKKADKIKFYEDAEEILETGHENKRRAAKAVKEVENKKNTEELAKENKFLEETTTKRRYTDFEYLKALRDITADYIQTIDYRDYPGWRVHLYITTGAGMVIDKKTFVTQRGLLAIIKSPLNKYFVKGMKASFDPVIDSGGAKGLGIAIEDSLDYYNGNMSQGQQDPNKLWTPNSKPN